MITSNLNMAAALLNMPTSGLRLESHMVFLCPECGKENWSQLEWRKHLNTVHNYANKTPADFSFKVVDDKHHECQICLKWVPNAHQTPAVLQYHRFNHLPYSKIYRCRHCRGSFLRKRSLCDHLFRAHYRLISKSDNERKIAVQKQESAVYQNPRLNKEFYIRFLCPQCGSLFDRFQYWIQHLDAAHTSTSVDLKMHRIACTRNYFCADCSYTLKNGPNRSQLQRHHFSHMPYPFYFQCAFCYSRKAYKTELLLHFLKYHPGEYAKCKQYVTIPDEWGGPGDDETIRQIQHFLKENKQKPRTDLLQRALRGSFINFEEDAKTVNSSNRKFSHDTALDRSLNGFDNVFVVEREQSVANRGCLKMSDIDDNDLEDICKEMFEEISDYSQPSAESTKLSNEFLQMEMQKYIHYLCPECGREFNNQNTWRSHVYEEHNLINAVESKFRPLNTLKTTHLCLVCFQVQHTSKHAELRRHHFQHMPFQSYLKCIICSKTKSSKPKMIQHLEYVHLIQIKKDLMASSAVNRFKSAAKKFRCLQCDKSYVGYLRFKNHCRTCPKRLTPPTIVKYDINNNLKLIEHLQKARAHIDKMYEESDIDADNIK